MIKLLINFTRKIVYILCLQNSGYTYSGIIISANVTGKYSKSIIVSRYAVGSVKVYTIWRLFVFRHTGILTLVSKCRGLNTC